MEINLSETFMRISRLITQQNNVHFLLKWTVWKYVVMPEKHAILIVEPIVSSSFHFLFLLQNIKTLTQTLVSSMFSSNAENAIII